MTNIKILTIDDSNLSRRRFVAGPLRTAGYEVIEATNGEEGLAAVKEHNPDLIICDLLMPIMDGFEFLANLRANNNTTPVIIASADIQETSRQKAESYDTFDFLNKPFKGEELLATVERAAQSLYSEVS